MEGSNRNYVQLLFLYLLSSLIFLISDVQASFTTTYGLDVPSGSGATPEAACLDLVSKINAFLGGRTRTFESIVNTSSEVTDACSFDYLDSRYPACLMGNGEAKGSPSYCTDVASITEVVETTYTIDIIPAVGKLKMIEPVGGIKSSLDLIAVVKNQDGIIQSGITVKLQVDVEKNSGGHKHDNAARHTKHAGTLSGTAVAPNTVTGKTGSSGYKFTFTAPAISGNHIVTASCVSVDCSQTKLNNILVGVDNLVPLGTGNWVLVGDVPSHPVNHYMTSESVRRLTQIAISYKRIYSISSPVLRINDASLERGGLFDIQSNWSNPHAEHRKGTVVDIRANTNTGTIPPKNWRGFKAIVRLKGGSSDLERFYNDEGVEEVRNRHFHVRLEGRSE